MRRIALAMCVVAPCLAIALPFDVAASKISDDAYRLVRELMNYKNYEINSLSTFNKYLEDCANASEQQGAAKKCSERFAVLGNSDRDLQVKHDVVGHEIAAHIHKHPDENWLFLGLMDDDPEFSNLTR